MATIILDDNCSQLSQYLVEKLGDVKHKEKLIWEPIENLVQLYLAFEVTEEYQENGLLIEEKELKNAFESEYQLGFVSYLTVSKPDIYKNSRYIVDQILTRAKFPILAYAKALDLWYDKSIALRILKEHPEEYLNICEELRSDNDILAIMLKHIGLKNFLRSLFHVSVLKKALKSLFSRKK